MAITVSVQPKSGRTVYTGSHFPYPIQFHFSKEGMDLIVQNRPGSDMDGLVRVWQNASGLEASQFARFIRRGFCQDATSPLPAFHFQTRLQSSTDVPDHIAQNQPGSSLALADRVRFWPNGSGPEARPVRKDHPARFWPALPSRSGLGLACLLGCLVTVL